jgi:hypothetical protein
VFAAMAEAALGGVLVYWGGSETEVVFGYLQHEVGVYKVIEGLQEDGQEAESGENTGESRYDPVDISSIS